MEENIKDQNLSELAIKNSGYGFARALILKFGGLFFTIIIARILLPELFGIYALAISIVTIFMTFTELGVNGTFLRYSSEALGKRDVSKARSYFKYLLKIKSFLVFIVIFVLLSLSKFLAYNLYDKPLLFYPLLFACLFILTESFSGFFLMPLIAAKNFKPLPFLELTYQITRISFSILAILVLSEEFKVAGLFIAFAFSGLINLCLIFLISYKKDKEIFFGKQEKIDKKRVSNFLGFMSIASLSLVFFTSIDILMMGKFVESAYVGYYRAALSLVLTIAAVFSISSVILPLFTQIHGERFKRGFQKTFRYLMLLSIPATMGILFLGKYLLKIYGNEYLPAIFPLYFLSLLIVLGPLTNLYTTILESRERTKILAKSVLISLIVNIVLNYIVIKSFLERPEYIIIGVGIATVISRFLYFGILMISGRRELNLKLKGIGLRKPILATLIMSFFLLIFNHFVNMNLFYGALEIILGAGIYFGVLLLAKGLHKEDWKLIKSLFKR